MRITIVTETFPPEVNGVALTVEGYARGLRGLGHVVDVIRPQRPDEAPAPVLTPSIPIPRYPELRMGLPCTGRLRRLFADQRPDALYIATEGPLGWSAMNAANTMGIPVATGFHTRFDDYATRYGLAPLRPLVFAWMRRFHNRGTATLVPTRILVDFLSRHGFRHPVQLGRAVDGDHFHPRHRDAALRDAWGVGPDGLAVIHFGRIAQEKNLPLVVRAFRAIQACRPDARLVWVGDGPARAGIERDHPDCIFAGMRRDLDLARHVASADLFVFPSTSETFGNVTLEAMAAGVATVAFDDGAAHEHIHDRATGRVLPTGDERGFVRAAVDLAMNDGQRRAIGEAARRHIDTLSHAQVARQLESILRGILPGDLAGAVA